MQLYNFHFYVIMLPHTEKYGHQFNELRISIAHVRHRLFLCVPKHKSGTQHIYIVFK